MLRSALIVAIPEAAPVVDGFREATCNDKPSIGVPPHVTVLFPFVPAHEIDDAIVEELRSLFGQVEPFRLELGELRRFPDTLYLAPTPSQAFVAMTELVVERFPAYLPYGGAFADIVPHLTVAHGEHSVLDHAAAAIRESLPIRAFASSALLLEETEPDWGRWRVRAHLPFSRRERRQT